jgi:phenylpropionate dioxygenase-like ring-hydroxylating dioxygenase large terminal subunit
MKHETQVALARRFFEHIDRKTTDMAPHLAYNAVSAYTCTERLARERQILFREHPLIVGFGCQIPRPGDFLTEDSTGLPVLVTRNSDGQVRAFVNVCRHRGAMVETAEAGCGRKVFTCPYHAWSYDLEGRLAGLPDGEGFAGLNREQYCLRELPAAERHGLLWVRHSPGAPIDPDALLTPPLAEELAAYGLADWHHFETRRLTYRLNWKGVVDTFLEAYHVGKLHRQTIGPLFHDNMVLFDAFGANHRMVLARKSIIEARDNPEAAAGLVEELGIVYVLFPNIVFNRIAEHMEMWRVYPGPTTDECFMYLTLVTPEPVQTDRAMRHWQNNLRLTIATVEGEDFPVGETIQANFHSDAQDYVTYGCNEPAMAHYHRSIRTALGEPAELEPPIARPVAAAATP